MFPYTASKVEEVAAICRNCPELALKLVQDVADTRACLVVVAAATRRPVI